MTRPLRDVERVQVLIAEGVSQAEASRVTGIPRSTIRGWAREGFCTANRVAAACDPCPHITRQRSSPSYAYLLGMYLGDGCLSEHARGVFRLRITLDFRYPDIIEECRGAIVTVLPNRYGEQLRDGCVEVGSYSKHWPCLFPQHGRGPKHRRPILLEPWQKTIALKEYPHMFLRGLMHSDGCRSENRIRDRYVYSRYQFSNRSEDIRVLFERACQQVGVACKRSNEWTVSVSRRADVARMDLFIGRKT